MNYYQESIESIEKGFIPEYAFELFNRLESMGYFNTLMGYLTDEDAKNFKRDLDSVRKYRSKNA